MDLTDKWGELNHGPGRETWISAPKTILHMMNPILYPVKILSATCDRV